MCTKTRHTYLFGLLLHDDLRPFLVLREDPLHAVGRKEDAGGGGGGRGGGVQWLRGEHVHTALWGGRAAEGVGLGGRQGGRVATEHSVVKSGERRVRGKCRLDGGVAGALVRRDVRLEEIAGSLVHLSSECREFFKEAVRVT